MKKLSLLLIIAFSTTINLKAIPNIGEGWNCGGGWITTIGDVAYSHDGIDFCYKTAKLNCTHWLWGSRTYSSGPWVGTCDHFVSGKLPDHVFDEDKGAREFIASEMSDIKNLNIISVPDKFCNSDSLLDDNVFTECWEFRLMLAGFDVDFDNPSVNDPCYVYVRTLPVLVPSAEEPEVNFSCIVVFPNPTIGAANISIDLGNNATYITKIELVVNDATLTIVYSKLSGFLPIENIPTNTLVNGNYFLYIHTIDEVKVEAIIVSD